jgi:hypothetical protein
MGVFSDIERGWRNNDVDVILQHFGKSKVSISIEGTGPSGGKFSKSQSYYLLKDLFKYTITKKFEFVQYRKPSEKGRTSFAVAERFYQKTDDGRLFKDKIYVSLHTDDGENLPVAQAAQPAHPCSTTARIAVNRPTGDRRVSSWRPGSWSCRGSSPPSPTSSP